MELVFQYLVVQEHLLTVLEVQLVVQHFQMEAQTHTMLLLLLLEVGHSHQIMHRMLPFSSLKESRLLLRQ